MSTEIFGFHAHVYFDADTRSTAERIRDALATEFGLKVGRMHDEPIGPHTRPMFEAKLTPAQFAAVVPWLMINRSGLSVLVHPTTNDPVADHDTNPLWMGEQFPVDVELVRRLVRAARTAMKAAHL